jgi:hypothetical protein
VDLNITPGNVVRISGNYFVGTSGEAINAGMPIARYDTDGLYYQSCADPAAASYRQTCDGISLDTVPSANRPLVILALVNDAVIDIGTLPGTGSPSSDVVQGEVYVVSHNQGAICDDDSLTTGDWLIILGVGSSVDNQIICNVATPGVQTP